MGLKPYYLGDTSALGRIDQPTVGARLVPLLDAGLIARCTPTDLEAGFSAPSQANYRMIKRQRSEWSLATIDQSVLDRAWEVQGLLAEREQHRGAALAGLIIAAAAERAALVVLHYDADYDLIAAVTGQATQWVVPAGTVD